MSIVTLTLAEFLIARYDAAEKDARECAKVFPPPWDVYDRGHSAKVQADKPNFLNVVEVDQDVTSGDWPGDSLRHIARHDPACVLADIAAKRAILRVHDGSHECPSEEDNCGWWMPDDDDPDQGLWCPTMRLLVQPYRDHPDYRQEWAA